MQVNLDRTQEWLNRTQAIKRTPAVRGGVVREKRTARQTASFMLTALLLLLAVFLAPRPAHEGTKRIASMEILPALTDYAGEISQPPPQPLPTHPLHAAPSRSRWSSQVLNEARIWHYPPRANRIAPHAPIWMVSEPGSWTAPGASSPSAPAQHLPQSGISILNR